MYFGQSFHGASFLPPSEKLIGSTIVSPYVFVGDEAFPLLPNMMRPIPGDGLDHSKRIYNYRLSRARRVIENAFGILVARWKILNNTLELNLENSVIKACIILHNILRSHSEANRYYMPELFVDWEDEQGNRVEGRWREIVRPGEQVLPSQGSRNSAKQANDILNNFMLYFNTVGKIRWQEDRIKYY